MKQDDLIHEGVLQDATITYTITEVQTICVVDRTVIEELVAYGIVEPIGSSYEQWIFNYHALSRTQKALRLHQDLAINWPGIALALELLDELEELRQTVATLKSSGLIK